MYVVKTVNNTRYILYPWANVRQWGWNQGLYFVHPNAEQRFIDYIKDNESVESVESLEL